MKLHTIKPLISLFILFMIVAAFEPLEKQDTQLSGSWQLKNGSNEDVLLFTDGYFTQTSYDKENKKFVRTRGGNYKFSNGQLTVQYEFDTQEPEQVGKSVAYSASVKNDALSANFNNTKQMWSRLDQNDAPLAGVWHITERMQDGQLVPIHRTGTRKTLKILTGKRFQWAAIDPGKKEFSGTGGGTYSFERGTYTENIEFFSRDNNRVGASLTFEGKLENGKWHHSGLSSRGDKIYEVWSKVNSSPSTAVR